MDEDDLKIGWRIDEKMWTKEGLVIKPLIVQNITN